MDLWNSLKNTAWQSLREEAALVLSLNLETLHHQRAFPSLCSMKEGMPSSLLPFSLKHLAVGAGEGGVAGNENENRTKAADTTFYGQRWS